MDAFLLGLGCAGIYLLLFGAWCWWQWNKQVAERLSQNEHDIQSIRNWLDEHVPMEMERENTKVNITGILERVRRLEGP